MRGNKEQITLTLPPETLTRLERMAREAGLTRAALLHLFIHRGLERGLS
jgi:predicted DNA-binding protein